MSGGIIYRTVEAAPIASKSAAWWMRVRLLAVWMDGERARSGFLSHWGSVPDSADATGTGGGPCIMIALSNHQY